MDISHGDASARDNVLPGEDAPEERPSKNCARVATTSGNHINLEMDRAGFENQCMRKREAIAPRSAKGQEFMKLRTDILMTSDDTCAL
jgi:hypothetical protein